MKSDYVLLTAAKNEEKYIRHAIESVVGQTRQPLVWVIMDDGSSDRTAEIVASFAEDYGFIVLCQARQGGERSFGAQYRAINAAYELVRNRTFEFVGMQDADIAPMDSQYYQKLLLRFAEDRDLGLTGGVIHERSAGAWEPRGSNSRDSVAGGVQFFRRQCFEEIGGYTPLLYGGEDWLVQITARSIGWDVDTTPDLPVRHYRPTSSAGGRWKGLFRLGMMDGSFGSSMSFEIAKCARRLNEKPRLLGSVVRLLGYLHWRVRGSSPLLKPELVKHLRREQADKLKALSRRMVGLR